MQHNEQSALRGYPHVCFHFMVLVITINNVFIVYRIKIVNEIVNRR